MYGSGGGGGGGHSSLNESPGAQLTDRYTAASGSGSSTGSGDSCHHHRHGNNSNANLMMAPSLATGSGSTPSPEPHGGCGCGSGSYSGGIGPHTRAQQGHHHTGGFTARGQLQQPQDSSLGAAGMDTGGCLTTALGSLLPASRGQPWGTTARSGSMFEGEGGAVSVSGGGGRGGGGQGSAEMRGAESFLINRSPRAVSAVPAVTPEAQQQVLHPPVQR